MTCIEPGCRRARMTSASGFAYALCEDHARVLLDAFGPVRWFERARAGTLPPLVVGGRAR